MLLLIEKKTNKNQPTYVYVKINNCIYNDNNNNNNTQQKQYIFLKKPKIINNYFKYKEI